MLCSRNVFSKLENEFCQIAAKFPTFINFVVLSTGAVIVNHLPIPEFKNFGAVATFLDYSLYSGISAVLSNWTNIP